MLESECLISSCIFVLFGPTQLFQRLGSEKPKITILSIKQIYFYLVLFNMPYADLRYRENGTRSFSQT